MKSQQVIIDLHQLTKGPIESNDFEIVFVEDRTPAVEGPQHSDSNTDPVFLLFDKAPSISEPGSLPGSLEGSRDASQASSGDIAIQSMSEGSYDLETTFSRLSESSSQASGSHGARASIELDNMSLRSHETSRQRTSSQRLSTIGSEASRSVRTPAAVPFLTWRLGWETDSRTDVERDQTLLQLLNRIHGSIASRRLHSLYSETVQLTAESATKRLQAITTQIGRSTETFAKQRLF